MLFCRPCFPIFFIVIVSLEDDLNQSGDSDDWHMHHHRAQLPYNEPKIDQLQVALFCLCSGTHMWLVDWHNFPLPLRYPSTYFPPIAFFACNSVTFSPWMNWWPYMDGCAQLSTLARPFLMSYDRANTRTRDCYITSSSINNYLVAMINVLKIIETLLRQHITFM